MKDFNLQVKWNAAEEKYDSALQIQEHTLFEIIGTMTDIIVHALDNLSDDEYDSAVAITATSLLIVRKLDNLYGDVFTLEQKQAVLAHAEEIDKAIGGEN